MSNEFAAQKPVMPKKAPHYDHTMGLFLDIAMIAASPEQKWNILLHIFVCSLPNILTAFFMSRKILSINSPKTYGELLIYLTHITLGDGTRLRQ